MSLSESRSSSRDLLWRANPSWSSRFPPSGVDPWPQEKAPGFQSASFQAGRVGEKEVMMIPGEWQVEAATK